MAIGVAQHLEHLRTTLPEDQYRNEVLRLAKSAIRTGKSHEEFWHGLIGDYEWVDWEALVAEAHGEPVSTGSSGPSQSMQDQMLEAMKQKLPGMKTQAQLNAFMGAFEALQLTLNAVFEGDASQVEIGKKAIDMALQVAVQATEISRQLEEMPEAVEGDAGDEFKAPASDTVEYDTQRELLSELAVIKRADTLSSWYEETTTRRNRIKSTGLRNHLLDAIRKKKLELS